MKTLLEIIKSTNYSGVGGGMDGENPPIPRASEIFPVQFNMLHHLVLICCFLHENVGFLHQVVIHQLNLRPSNAAVMQQGGGDAGGDLRDT